MVNILVFRTDKIGDLLLTIPTILTIKKYFGETDITLVASEKNYKYAENFDIFSQIYQFPKKNIVSNQVFWVVVEIWNADNDINRVNNLGKLVVSLPIYPGLKKKQINYICSKIKLLINKCKKD